MANPQWEDGFTKIANEIMEALAKIHMPPQCWRVLVVVLRKTYGWSKIWDYMALSKFREATGMSKSNIIRARDKLVTHKIVLRAENARGVKYRFNKDFHVWKKFSIQRRGGLYPENEGGLCLGNEGVSKQRPTKETLTKEKEKKEECAKRTRTPVKKKQRKKTEPTGDHQKVIDYFCKSYQTKFGIPYQFAAGKDGKAVKTLLHHWKYDRTLKLIDAIFDSDDPFYRPDKGGITLGILLNQANKLAQKLIKDGDRQVKPTFSASCKDCGNQMLFEGSSRDGFDCWCIKCDKRTWHSVDALMSVGEILRKVTDGK